MSSIAEDFNAILYREVMMHAAWPPVTNSYAVGDYGDIKDGVFRYIGNVQTDFHVDYETVPGGVAAKLDFTSEQVRLVRIVANAEVGAFPDGPVSAGLKIEFEKDQSFYLKAELAVTRMSSMMDVASQLALIGPWQTGKFKVVSGVYTGRNCLFLANRKGRAEVLISGKADALQRLEVGKLDSGLQITSTGNLGLQVVGESGVVGLEMFKVERSGDAALEGIAPVRISESKTWGADLQDDV